MRQPPPGARIDGEKLAALLQLAYKAWSRFAYGDLRVFAVFCLAWVLMHALRLYLTPALFTSRGGINAELLVTYIVLNVFGVLIGAGVSYIGLRWSIASWRSTMWTPMILASMVTIVGLTIMVFCPFFFEYLTSYNHAVYMCMVDRGMNTRGECDAIVSQQYQQQPPWRPFFEYRPER